MFLGQMLCIEFEFLFIFVLVSNISLKKDYRKFNFTLLGLSVAGVLLSLLSLFMNLGNDLVSNFILLGIAVLLFLFAVISYVRNKKINNILIPLKSDEYDISIDMRRTTNGGSTILSKIIFKDGVIDSAIVPYDKIDATFICFEKGNNEYSCRGYVDDSEGYTLKKVLNRVSRLLAVICSLIISILIAYKQTYGFAENQEYLEDVLRAVIILLFSVGMFKCFRNNKDIVAVIMRIAALAVGIIALRRIGLTIIGLM